MVFSLVFFMKYRISELEKKKKEWNLYLSLIFYRVNQAMTVLVTIDYDRVTNRSLLPRILSPTDIYYEIWWSKCPAVDWAKWWHYQNTSITLFRNKRFALKEMFHFHSSEMLQKLFLFIDQKTHEVFFHSSILATLHFYQMNTLVSK